MDIKDDDQRDRSVDAGEPARAGDVLGLGGSAVPKAPSDPTTEYDEESIARRRARAAGEDELATDRTTTHGPGATGIDMGGGGTGTDVE